MSRDIVERPWYCHVTGRPVGTDTVMIGAPPCACQGCRAAAEITTLRSRLAKAEARVGDLEANEKRLENQIDCESERAGDALNNLDAANKRVAELVAAARPFWNQSAQIRALLNAGEARS